MHSEPAAEIIMPDGSVYRIWASGKVEGFGDAATVINRIPWIVSQATAKAREA